MSAVTRFIQGLHKQAYSEQDIRLIQYRLRAAPQLWQSCLALPELFGVFLQASPPAAQWKPGWLGLQALAHCNPAFRQDPFSILTKTRHGQALLNQVYLALTHNNPLPLIPTELTNLPMVVQGYLCNTVAGVALFRAWQQPALWQRAVTQSVQYVEYWRDIFICFASWLKEAELPPFLQWVMQVFPATQAAAIVCHVLLANVDQDTCAAMLQTLCAQSETPAFAHACQSQLQQFNQAAFAHQLVTHSYQHAIDRTAGKLGYATAKSASTPVPADVAGQLARQLELGQALSAEIAVQLGHVYAYQANPLAALSAYETAFQLMPDAKLLPYIFQMKLLLGRTIEAEATIREMPTGLADRQLAQVQLAVRRSDFETAVNLAKSINHKQLSAEQQAQWLHILEQVTPTTPDLNTALGDIYHVFAQQQPANTSVLQKYTQLLLKQKNFAQAKNNAIEWMSLQPDAAEAYLALAQTVKQSAQADRDKHALNYLQKAWQLEPNHTSIAIELAETAFAVGDYVTCQHVCQHILNQHRTATQPAEKVSTPCLARTHLLLGQMLDLSNANTASAKDGKSLVHYQKVSELCPDDPVGWYEQAQFYDKHGQANRAVSVLESHQSRIDTTAPYADRFFAFLGELYHRNNDNSLAIQSYLRASHLAPDCLEYTIALGHIYQATGQSQLATQAYQHVLAAQPAQIDVCLRLGELLEENNEPRLAFDYLHQAYQYQQNHQQPPTEQQLVALGRLGNLSGNQSTVYTILAESAQRYPQNLELAVFTGKAAEKLGLYDVASESYRRAYQLTPQSNTDLLVRQASCQIALKKPQSAIVLLEDVFDKDDEVYRLLGQAYKQTGLWREAANAFQDASYKVQGDQVLLHEAALAYTHIGDWVAACAVYDELIAIAPDNAIYYAEQGKLYFEQGKTADAHRAFDKARTLSPNNPTILVLLGRCLQSDGHIEAAVAVYEEAIIARQHHPQLWEELGDLYESLDNKPRALAAYQNAIAAAANPVTGSLTILNTPPKERRLRCLRKAFGVSPRHDTALLIGLLLDILKFDPVDQAALYDLGVLQTEQGQYRPAIVNFRQLLTLNPNAASAAIKAAEAAEKLGNWQYTADFLKRALQVRANDATLWLKLAQMQFKLGQYDAVIASLNQAEQARPHWVVTQLYLAQVQIVLGALNEAQTNLLHVYQGNNLTEVADQLLLAELLLLVLQPAAAYHTFKTCSIQENGQRAWLGLLSAVIENGEYAQLAKTFDQHPTANSRYLDVPVLEARQVLEQTLALVTPQSPACQLLQVRWLHCWGEATQATAGMQHLAQQSSQGDLAVWIRVAYLELRAKHYTAAQHALQQAEKIAPQDARLLLVKGMLALETGQYGAALHTAQAAQQVIDHWELAYLLQSRVYAAQQDWEAAAQAHRQALHCDGQQAVWYSQLAKLHRKRQDLAAGLAAQQQAVEIATQLTYPPVTRATLYAELAELEAQDGAFADALQHYQQALQLLPDMPNWQVAVGNLNLALLQPRPALHAFQRAAYHLPQAIEPLLGQARAYFALRQYGKCSDLLQTVAAHNPQNAQVFWMLGKSLRAQKLPEAAAEHYQRAHRLQPTIPDIATELAQLALERQQPREALLYGKKVVELQPDDAASWVLLGDVHSQLAEWQPACQAYRAALQQQPSSAVTLKLGKALYHSGQLDQALVQFQQALQQSVPDPAEQSDIYQNIAQVYDARRAYLLCAQNAEKAAALAKHNAKLWHWAGKQYLEAEQPTDAVRCLAQAHTLAPNEKTVQRDFEIAQSRQALEETIL